MTCEICQEMRNQDYLVLKFDIKDENAKLFPFFQEQEGLLCMCDYIVFVEEPRKLTAILVELKHHSDSPERQIYINMPFARFLVERLKEVDETVFDGVSIHYRGIGVKAKYRSRPFTKGYEMTFNDKDYALLPNPRKMYLTLICDSDAPGDA